MFRKIIFIVLFSLFLSACSDSEGINYDYSNINNTIGLSVAPSNYLQFTDSNLGDTLEYKLFFSTEELTPLGIDNNTVSYGSSFQNIPEFDPVACLSEAAYNGYCSLKIKMLDNAKEGVSGSIRLMFYYNLDNSEKTVGEIKYHQLTFEYKNKPQIDNNTDNTTTKTVTDIVL